MKYSLVSLRAFMAHPPIKPIVYSSIEQKNLLEREMFTALSPSEALIRTLDMMDLFASMRKRPHHPEDDMYPWIILKFKEESKNF